MNQQALSPTLLPPYGLELPGVVWGLDPSTLRLSAGVIVPEPSTGAYVHWQTCSYSQAGGMERRLASALGSLLPFLTDLRNECGTPMAVYLEQPFAGGDKPDKKTGKVLRPHPHSYYFVGVVLCALGHLFADVPVTMIDPATWKAQAMGKGRGHAKKEEILAWAQGVGYTGLLQDEADAIAIATAGAVLEEQKRGAA